MVDLEVLHLGDELAHPLQGRLLAAGMDLERSAAALQRRDQHFASMGCEDPGRGSIDVREKRVLHAPGEQRDPQHPLSPGAEVARRPRRQVGSAERWCHVVETAQGLRHQASHRVRLQRPAESQCLGERNRGRDGAHPPRVRQHGEECCARSPDAQAAGKAPFDLRANLLDQTVVLHAGGTRIDACHAAEACIPVAHHLLVHADLSARREVHEQDAPARRIHLLAPEQIGRTRGKAETAMHAVGDQSRIGRMVIVEREGRRTRACVARHARRTCGHAGHLRCRRPGAPG